MSEPQIQSLLPPAHSGLNKPNYDNVMAIDERLK